MSRKRLGIVVLVAIGLAAVAGTLAARWPFRQPAPLPQSAQQALTVDPRHLDFGEVWETDRFEWTVPVHNQTDSAFQASAYSSSCSCVSPSSTKLIPPSETAPLTFRVDLFATRCASAEPRASRDVKVPVTIDRDTSPTEKPISVELRGRVKSAIVVPASRIDFGRFAATATPKARVIPIRSLVGLRELGVTTEGTPVLTELKFIASSQWELQVQPVIPSPVGRHEAKVKLTPITGAGEAVPPIAIPVAFDVLHDIQPDTSLVPLGAGGLGEPLSGTLTVSSLSGRPFPLLSCESGDVTVQPSMATAPQSSHTFKLERKVTVAGNHVGAVFVRGRDADGQPFELRVEVQWYGTSP